MKNKILIGVLAFAMCFMFAACGNKTDDKDAVDAANVENLKEKAEEAFGDTEGIHGSSQQGAGLDNVAESNYAQVMKDNFGIDPITGDGWTVRSVSSPNKVNNLHINYKTPKDITPDEWKKKYFDATNAVSTDGIYGVKMDMNTGALSKGPKVSDYDSYKAGKYSGWYYTWNGRQIQINASIHPGDALIMFTFTEGK